MKRMLIFMVLSLCVFSACSKPQQTDDVIPFATDTGVNISNSTNESNTNAPAVPVIVESKKEDSPTAKSKVLIVYFSRVGNTDFPMGVDAKSGASLIVKDGTMYGNTQYLAHLIQRATGGKLFLIQTEVKYPVDYDATVDQGDKEGKAKARPKLASHLQNIADYEIVFLGFPNWWYDMPMALYTFLNEYDLSGKTVIPFSTSGGSGFSNTISSIQLQEPKAKVVTNGLTVLDSNIANYKFEDVDKWVKSLGVSF